MLAASLTGVLLSYLGVPCPQDMLTRSSQYLHVTMQHAIVATVTEVSQVMSCVHTVSSTTVYT